MFKFSWSEPEDGSEALQPVIYVDKRTGDRGIIWPLNWPWWRRILWRLAFWEW